MGQPLPTGSPRFATHGANKRDVGMSNAHDWAAFDCFRLDVSKFDDDYRLCGDDSLDRCFWFWPECANVAAFVAIDPFRTIASVGYRDVEL